APELEHLVNIGSISRALGGDMCGENTNRLSYSQIHALYRLTVPEGDSEKRPHEIDQRPGRWGIVIRSNPATGRRSAAPRLWGLIPHWARDPAQFQKTYNARAETIAERRAFAVPFRKRRCLIPVDAFIEPKTVGKGRRGKYAFGFADGSPMTIAG